MTNLVKADLYRIFRGAGIYIAMILIIIMSVTSIVMKEAGYIGNANIDYGGDTIVKEGGFFTDETSDLPEEHKM